MAIYVCTLKQISDDMLEITQNIRSTCIEVSIEQFYDAFTMFEYF